MSYFGYSLEDELLASPPHPAGDHLLSDNERINLDRWLEVFMGSTTSTPTDNILSVDAVHSDHWNDMPPVFVGSSTSFGPSETFSPDYGLSLMPVNDAQSLARLQPQQQQQQQQQLHQRNQMQSMPAVSHTSPTMPLHTPSSLARQFAAATAATMHANGLHNQMPSEDVFSAANALMRNSHTPISRHASFDFQTSQTNLAAPYRSGHLTMQNDISNGTHNGMPNGINNGMPTGIHNGIRNGTENGITTLDPLQDPLQLSPSALLQAANFIADPKTSMRHASIASNGMGLQDFQGLQLGNSPAFGAAAASSSGQAAHGPELQWGTDQSFRNKQFIPRSHKETSDAIINQQLEVMECLAVNPSADTTRHATPARESPQANGINGTNGANVVKSSNGFGSNDELVSVLEVPDDMAPPRKKRKSKSTASTSKPMVVSGEAHDESAIDAHGEDDDDDAANAAGLTKNDKPRKRKTKAAAPSALSIKSSGSSPDLDANLKRSASQDGNNSPGAQAPGTPTAAAAAKRRRSTQARAPRENLSEEQKRENHIRSEQKRRELIKGGYEGLVNLVPGLNGGNHSKSTMLTMTANYLEELLEGNRLLSEKHGV